MIRFIPRENQPHQYTERWFRFAVIVAVVLTLALGVLLLPKHRAGLPLSPASGPAPEDSTAFRDPPSAEEPAEGPPAVPLGPRPDRVDEAASAERTSRDDEEARRVAATERADQRSTADRQATAERRPASPAPSPLSPAEQRSAETRASPFRPEPPGDPSVPARRALPEPVPLPPSPAAEPTAPAGSPTAPTAANRSEVPTGIESPPLPPPAPPPVLQGTGPVADLRGAPAGSPPAPPAAGSVADLRSGSLVAPPGLADAPPSKPPVAASPPREAQPPHEAAARPGSAPAAPRMDGPAPVPLAPARPPDPVPPPPLASLPPSPAMTRGAPPPGAATGAALAAVVPPAETPGLSVEPRPGRAPAAGVPREARATPAVDSAARPPALAVPPPAIDAARRALVSVRAGNRGERTGLGFVVDAGGYIITTHRLVQGTHAVEVGLHDGRRLPVTLIARDPLNELAVLKVDAAGLPAIALGESSALRVGEPVMAVGRSAAGAAAATAGRISATSRATGADLVTDLSLSRDRAGSPVLNGRGEAVGMANGAAGGGTAAVPIDRVKPILRDLKKPAVPASAGVGLPAR